MPEENKTKQPDFANMPEVPEEERLEWCYQNVKRIIYFINTFEHWRHAKFKSLDEVVAAQKEEQDDTGQKEETDSKGADGESKSVNTDSDNPA